MERKHLWVGVLCLAALALVAVQQSGPMATALEAVVEADGKGSKMGKQCIDLAKRAKSSGLKPGDRTLAKSCFKLATGAEKAARMEVAQEKKAKRAKMLHRQEMKVKELKKQKMEKEEAVEEKMEKNGKKAPFTSNKEVPITVNNKKFTLHLYRPHGFREKLAHPHPGALAVAQARQFGAVDPAFMHPKPSWKKGAKKVSAASYPSVAYADNTPLSIKQHLAKNNMPWWKKDTNYGFKASEHKATLIKK